MSVYTVCDPLLWDVGSCLTSVHDNESLIYTDCEVALGACYVGGRNLHHL
jgi:hypothetical protein